MVILVYREKEQVAAQFVEKNSNRFTTEVKAHSEKEPMTVKKKILSFYAETLEQVPQGQDTTNQGLQLVKTQIHFKGASFKL